MTVNSEIEAMQIIDDALDGLQLNERERVLAWASSKYGIVPSVSNAGENIPKQKSGTGKTGKAKGKASKKANAALKMIKDLDLHPNNAVSAKDFVEKKRPSNGEQKGVVAAYYLREHANVEEISVDHVYTFFKTVGWQIPSDLKNTLQRAGSMGWLDTSDSQSITITTGGDNLIEFDLPAKEAS